MTSLYRLTLTLQIPSKFRYDCLNILKVTKERRLGCGGQIPSWKIKKTVLNYGTTLDAINHQCYEVQTFFVTPGSRLESR